MRPINLLIQCLLLFSHISYLFQVQLTSMVSLDFPPSTTRVLVSILYLFPSVLSHRPTTWDTVTVSPGWTSTLTWCVTVFANAVDELWLQSYDVVCEYPRLAENTLFRLRPTLTLTLFELLPPPDDVRVLVVPSATVKLYLVGLL